MEKDLTIVSSKTAKELKDFGFDIICPNCYGVAIMHNGEELGFDEEYELRAEGRGDEIVTETVEVADIGLESLGSALGQSGVVVIRAFRRGETLD